MKRIMLILCVVAGFGAHSTLPMNYWNRTQRQRQCNACFGDFNQNDAVRLGCNHYALCPDCLHDRVTEVIQGGRLADLHCSTANCNHRFTQQEIRNIIQDPAVREQYAQLQRDRVARLAEGLTPDQREIIRNNRNIKPCPECLDLVQKNGGCNHMTCRTNNRRGGCGHEFCWIDMQPWGPDHANDHHFGDHPHLEVRYDDGRQHDDHLSLKSFFIVTIVIPATCYGAYKLYHYINGLKPVPEKSLKEKLEDLHNEIIKARRKMHLSDRLAADMLREYFIAQEKKGAFKDLSSAQLATLKKLVKDVEWGLIFGDCDKEHAAFVKFMQTVDRPINTVPAEKKSSAQVVQSSKKVRSKNRPNRRVKENFA